MNLHPFSLNALRAFEAAARLLSFTQAAKELCVTQAAISHQIKTLEGQLGRALFLRGPRSLQLTDEGLLLAPALRAAFEAMAQALDRVREAGPPEVLSLGVVGTFAQGLLLERLGRFEALHPRIELRLQTHNNRMDPTSEALDATIRFGDGLWRSQAAVKLLDAPLSALCSPALAAGLTRPDELRGRTLLRSFRAGDWEAWGKVAGAGPLRARGPQFDSSVLMVQAALQGLGVALAPPRLFQRELRLGQLVQPFAATVDTGAYWLCRPSSRPASAALQAFETWLRTELG
ncbi:LysR family transcriptional regulator of beta-lactamase [Inhella inkyongensis]|uniref:LysR family transcriptional regulator of beta-lactamase n=1 Tax=Inhella inkyongensis TaxID=392593 RepID=A0A840S5H9_9BURK|nr:LysR family transcriptional regulator [Inhella inkyongensis]MBB5204738.1 LysR family transcriptional regulator of beta-lactamase [Inhella inkyongensis]